MKDQKEIMVFTKKGMAIKVKANDYPIQKRGGMGIKAIMLRQGDEIVAVLALN